MILVAFYYQFWNYWLVILWTSAFSFPFDHAKWSKTFLFSSFCWWCIGAFFFCQSLYFGSKHWFLLHFKKFQLSLVILCFHILMIKTFSFMLKTEPWRFGLTFSFGCKSGAYLNTIVSKDKDTETWRLENRFLRMWSSTYSQAFLLSLW